VTAAKRHDVANIAVIGWPGKSIVPRELGLLVEVNCSTNRVASAPRRLRRCWCSIVRADQQKGSYVPHSSEFNSERVTEPGIPIG
jgi:hypothetical protein